MKPKICVVGSANIDQVSYVKRAPNDGETLFGEDYLKVTQFFVQLVLPLVI